ncbi:MAG: VWA domain-containing protein [Planctomycetota bacterium]
MFLKRSFFFFFFCVGWAQSSQENAVLSLVRLYQSREEWSRPSVLETLKTLGPQAIPILGKIIQGKDYLLGVTALELLTKYEEPAGLQEMLELLKVKEWRIKVSLLQILRTRKDSSVLLALVEMMDREEGRVLNDVIDTLHLLSGKKFGTDSVKWRKYLAGELSEEELEGKSVPLYFDIAVYSKKVVFVMDVSYSMSWGNRREIAEQNLTQTLQTLKGDVEFNLILFGDQIHPWKPKLVKVTSLHIRQAVQRMKAIPLKSGTNTYEALEVALNLEGVDTIFFLSDGYPTFGPFRKPEEILRELAKINQNKKIRINTIGIFRGSPPEGHQDSEPDKEELKKFMKDLAEAHFGSYRFIQ